MVGFVEEDFALGGINLGCAVVLIQNVVVNVGSGVDSDAGLVGVHVVGCCW